MRWRLPHYDRIGLEGEGKETGFCVHHPNSHVLVVPRAIPWAAVEAARNAHDTVGMVEVANHVLTYLAYAVSDTPQECNFEHG